MLHQRHRQLAALVPATVLLLLSTQPPAAQAQLQGIGDFVGLFRAWPFHCQDPLPLGQPCVEDYDCNATQGHHCHVRDRVCARGQPVGAPCNGGNGACVYVIYMCVYGYACRGVCRESAVDGRLTHPH